MRYTQKKGASFPIEKPAYGGGSVGYDILSPNKYTLSPGSKKKIPIGLQLEIPEQFYIEIHSKSGIGCIKGLEVAASPTIIDPDYRGQIFVVMKNTNPCKFVIERGEAIAQMIMKRRYGIAFKKVRKLRKSLRGRGGFGSSGAEGGRSLSCCLQS